MQRKGAFDYILLETTGLADPGMFPMLALNISLNRISRPNCIDILAQ